MTPMIMANDRQPMISYSCLVVTMCLSILFFQDIDEVIFSRSRPFRLLPVVIGPRWPVSWTSSMTFP